MSLMSSVFFFFFQAEDGIRDVAVTGVQTCALPILIDDVIGLVILGVVSALAAGTAFSLQGALRILGVAVVFLFVALWMGLKLAPRLFSLVDRMRVRGVLVGSAFAFLLLLCVLAERAGTALILGAFAARPILSEA